MGSAYSTYGEKGNAFRVLVGEIAERKNLEKLGMDEKHRIKMDRRTRDCFKIRQV
jgi:hypothetical protein